MKKDTVVSLKKPVEESDPLTALLRAGARQLLHEAVAAELAEYLSQYQAEREADGRRCMVRNGYLPARTVMTGLGEVRIQVPKTRDRRGRGRHFTSALLPPYIKRTASVESVLPWLLRITRERSAEAVSIKRVRYPGAAPVSCFPPDTRL